MISNIRRRLKGATEEISLPAPARAARRRDAQGWPGTDPGPERVIEAGILWLYRAQDCSASRDGGVARHYSLVSGWASSYPETTGYIVPTLIAYATLERNAEARRRARTMLDWLVSIQLPSGGYQGGRVDTDERSPVTFNTGQILIGLAAGVEEFGDYREPMQRAADWLLETQDPDGCWRRHPTPFANPGEKAYETHVSWGLFEAERIAPQRGYADAALANVRWALGNQRENGWPDKCCLRDPARPLTHTIGYFLRGILEAYRFSKDSAFLSAARVTADGLLEAVRPDGYLAGRLRDDWSPAVDWVCLTGAAQIAQCWLMLYRYTGDTRYLEAGRTVNRWVRCTIDVDGAPDTRGAVKGSFPIDGDYGKYQYLSWAAKFCIDSNLLERELARETRHDGR